MSPAGVGVKPQGAEVEVAERLLEIDVEPFAAGGPALPFGHLEEPPADPAVRGGPARPPCRPQRRVPRRPRPR